MANRTYNQFAGTLERKVVKLFAKIKMVAGAPVLVTSEVLNSSTSPVTINPSQGFESLSSSGTGIIELVLGANNGGVPTYDPYVRLLNLSLSVVGPFTSNNLISTKVIDDNVNGASGNPSIEFELLTTGGGPGPGFPDNGDVILVELTLSNTTAY